MAATASSRIPFSASSRTPFSASSSYSAFLKCTVRSTILLPYPTLTKPSHAHPLAISFCHPRPPAATPSALVVSPSAADPFLSRFAPGKMRKGADILVEALERHGVTTVFAYPGGASMEIHQALTRTLAIRNVLPRHEQGGVFAAEGYAWSTGFPGVCISSSGPGATNLVSSLADAMMDSVPVVTITGQVPRRMLGTNAFQEIPIVEVTSTITKHNYLILDVDDIPRVVSEAFFLATSGRPGPVLIDVPKDVQEQLAVPSWDLPVMLPGYTARLPKLSSEAQLGLIARLILEAKKPVLYVGGGSLNSSAELKQFVELTGIPHHKYSSSFTVIMHGTVYANYALDKSDLLLAFGVRFDDRVTGKIEAFASRAKIVHIDIDSDELGKIKQPHVSVCGDLKLALQGINRILEDMGVKGKLDLGAWREEINVQKEKFPLSYKTFDDEISPQYAIEVLDELTNGDAIITTGVGQHQMWAAQFYKYKSPRQWLTSGGFGAMGFGLPAAMGAAVANPGAVVVDIDGDGSFLMNVQELATVRVENLPVKILLLNNQHLGMAVQWEDRFYKGNRGHSYLGDPSRENEIFPNMLKFADACGIPAVRVMKKEELRAAIQKMLETPGPYLLDVIVPYPEHVLPMIPTNGSFEDVITEGDGRTRY
uniref:Acetolactate synthase n=1 Tax=Phaseolus vulgaris TaxID=3885 RepID=V7AYC7_PHAVU|nr:hypothetical protein PHAVU_009G222200g [Phaseolus vulgaris]ESW10589.1 hypothetical protein PHAVU_009G222200g [Phaseolus vulgaris]